MDVGYLSWLGQTIIMQIALIGILVLVVMGVGLFFKIHNRKNHRLRQKPSCFLHPAIQGLV